MPEIKNRTLIVKFDNKEVKKISFPENWTFTFSGFIPKMNDRGFAQSRPSLRIYGPKKTQMACFTDVDMVRDVRIEVYQVNKTELDDVFLISQDELDLMPVLKNGEVKSPEIFEEDGEERYLKF